MGAGPGPSIRAVQAHTSASKRFGEGSPSPGTQVQQFILKGRKHADVVHLLLFIQRTTPAQPRAYLPWLAHTVCTATFASCVRSVSSTISPPWLRSATIALACRLWYSAIACWPRPLASPTCCGPPGRSHDHLPLARPPQCRRLPPGSSAHDDALQRWHGPHPCVFEELAGTQRAPAASSRISAYNSWRPRRVPS